jgi:hydrogenase expression/formation protein HypE
MNAQDRAGFAGRSVTGLKALDFQQGRVDIAQGAGGKATAQLIDSLFQRYLQNEWLTQGDDGAVLPPLAAGGRLVMTTDAHVVAPLFFPGGDIGMLAVHGAINDLAVMGARPLWLSAAFILEEGLLLADLARIVRSMARASAEAGVPVVTGDTKVVEKGKGDQVFITTTGVGVLSAALTDAVPGGQNARPGDVILVSGSMGDHGMAVMSARESLEDMAAGMNFMMSVRSDTAALHGLVEAILSAGVMPHVMRDPTRGGLGATLNEIARQSGVGLRIEEEVIPVQPQVAAMCEFLGLDPLYLANEGKLILICARAEAHLALSAMRAHPLGGMAAIIGEVVEDDHAFVEMVTRLGGHRLVDWLFADPLPRIC